MDGSMGSAQQPSAWSSFIGSAATAAGAIFGGPVGAIAGPVISGILGRIGAEDEQNEQRDRIFNLQQFQTAMSNTAYQRAVEDMKAAGLNPMLAYQQGGASVPTGSTGAPPPNVALSGYSAAQAAASVAQTAATVDKTRAETKNIDANTDLTAWTAAQAAAKTRLDSSSAARLEYALENIDPNTADIERFKVQPQQLESMIALILSGGGNPDSPYFMGDQSGPLAKARLQEALAKSGMSQTEWEQLKEKFGPVMRELRARATAAELGLSRSRAESSFFDMARRGMESAGQLNEGLRGWLLDKIMPGFDSSTPRRPPLSDVPAFHGQ